MKRFFATMFLVGTALFTWGCVGDPTTGQDESDTESDAIESVDEPSADPAFAMKCPPDSCGFFCYTYPTKPPICHHCVTNCP